MRSPCTTSKGRRSSRRRALTAAAPAGILAQPSRSSNENAGGLRSAMTVGQTLPASHCIQAPNWAVPDPARGVCMPGPSYAREAPVYREIFVPVDNSVHSDWAVERAIDLCRKSGGRLTGNHVYAARLHDVRFRQLETGLPARFQTPDEIKKQRKIHDKLIEKGLQLIADSFLDQLAQRCAAACVGLRRQLLEGINYEAIVNEVNRGAGRLPGLIGFDPDRAAGYDGGDKIRADVRVGRNGRLVAEEADAAERLASSSGLQCELPPGA